MADILYFGRLIDLTGCSSETIQIDDTTKDTSTLRASIDTQYNASGEFLSINVRIAINGEIASEPVVLQNTDEIAFLPPVGGG